MIKGFFNIPWFVWAVFALIVAIVYVLVWPQKAAAEATGFRFFIVRWGHALTWLLLAISFVLRGISPSFTGMANWMALIGGLMYILFLVTTFMVK